MRKIWFMLLLISSVCVFTACSDDDDNGDGDSKGPITELILSDKVSTGVETTILGKGFAEGDKLIVADAAGERTEIEGAVASATGMTFTLPETLAAGKYSLILKRGADDWTLGEFEVVQTKEITVVKKFIVTKTIKEEGEDDWGYDAVWDLGYDDHGRLTSFTTIGEAEDGSEMKSVLEFTWSGNKIETGGSAVDPAMSTYPATYILENGKVKSSETTFFDWDEGPIDLKYDWTYSGDYLSKLTGTSNIAYNFENGNLVSIKEDQDFGLEYTITYSDKVNPTDIDYLAYYLYAIVDGKVDRVWPYILGVAGKISKDMPESVGGVIWQDMIFDTATGLLKSFNTSVYEEGVYEDWETGEPVEYKTTTITKLSFEYDTVRVLVD